MYKCIPELLKNLIKEEKMKKSLIRSSLVLSLVFLLCLAFSCKKQAEDTDPGAELKARVRLEINEAYNKGNLDVLDDMYSPDVLYHLTPYPDVVGLEAYKQYITAQRTSYPDIKLTIQEIIVDGDNGAMRWTFEGTHEGDSPTLGISATGNHVKFTGTVVFHTVEGKGVEIWNNVDWMSLLKQLGYTFTPPQVPEKEETN